MVERVSRPHLRVGPILSASIPSSDHPKVCERTSLFLRNTGFIRLHRVEPKYSGHCKAGGWNPIGTVKAKQWVTTCCNA